MNDVPFPLESPQTPKPNMPDITNLANELLCIIFLNAIEDFPPKMAQYCPTEYPGLFAFEAPHILPILVKAPLNPFIGASENSLPCPVTLSRVCKQWQSIAYALPSLWARIYVSDPTPKHVSLTRQWLERARSYSRPISLVFHQSEIPTSPCLDKAAEDILLLFIAHSLLWKHIHFRLTATNIRLLNDKLCDKSQFPKIKSAALSFIQEETEYMNVRQPGGTEYLTVRRWDETYRETVNVAERIWTKIHCARTLESITWFATWTHFDFRSDTPWRCLTQLNIQTPLKLNRLLSVLDRCKQLEVLLVVIFPSGFHLRILEPECDFDPRIVVCSQLKTLRLHLIDRREGSWFLDNLNAPSLKKLSLSAAAQHPTQIGMSRIDTMFPPKHVLQAFLSRSNSSLEELRLQYYHHDRATVHQYITEIGEFHLLITLEVFGDISLDTFRHFSEKTRTGLHRIMPNLESLVLTCCKPEITKPRALIMAQSRWHKSIPGGKGRTPGSLKNIYISPFQRHGTASGMPRWRTPLLGTSDVC